MRKGALYIRHQPSRALTKRTPTTRCERCCKHYVHIEAHKAKCTAPERVAMKPINEIEAALERIGARHGVTLAQMQGRDRSEMATDARRECYAYLRREKWSVLAMAAFFNRHERTVWQAINPASRERRREYMQIYMRDWRAKQGASA